MRVLLVIETAGLILCAIAAPALGQKVEPASPKRKEATRNFAQDLVDKTLARHSELLGLDIHSTPPNSAHSAIAASKNPDRIWRKTEPDLLEVLKTGSP